MTPARSGLLLVLLAFLAVGPGACSSDASGPESDARDTAAPLDWGSVESSDPVEAATTEVPEPLPEPIAEAPAPEVDAIDEVDAVDAADAADANAELDGVEPDVEQAVEIVEPIPEVVEATEAEPNPDVPPSDPGPEADLPWVCVNAVDCESFAHPACPGWWTCDGLCAWSCPSPLDLYDLGDLEDDQQLFAEVLAETEQVFEGANFRVQEVRFRSFEWTTGTKTPIAIHGYLAHPQAGTPLKPGVLLLTGLQGLAAAADAMQLANQADAVVLVLDGPGQGGSLGHGPSSGLGVLFATSPDPRAAWFVAYAVAASRGLTWLKAYPIVQPTRLAVVGRRLGGVVALLVNAIDRRVRAVVALEAAGDLPTAMRQGGWYQPLLTAAGLAPYDPDVDLWASRADPLAYAPFQHGPVLLAIGAQDEYHPLPTTLATYAALPGDAHRLALIANWDAGWYASASGAHNTFDNSAKAEQVLRDATTTWLRHHLADDPAYPMPARPQVAREDAGLGTRFFASCASGADDATARVYYSTDAASTFTGVPLSATGPGTWSATIDLLSAISNESNLVYFSELTIPVGPDGAGATFTFTSVPHTYPTFVPVLRPM